MGRNRRPKFSAAQFDSIVSGVKSIYREKIRPLEEQYMIKDFHYPLLTDDDFDAKPMVLLVGSYSTGKTSFIRYILEQDFPGMHVGPEPTTDGFQAILYGPSERQLPGHTLVETPSSPFRELSQFGNNFLQRFSGCEVASDFARGCTLIDTPGILAGRKQTDHRNYSYADVLRWFAPRCDIILLMFDANKVDISDELRDVIKLLEGYDDKIRVVLNKADSMDPSDLLKVNSGLTWNLARILRSPEVRRIYVGSFWDQPLQPSYMAELFEKEACALLADLASAPRNNTTSKLNDLVARARMVRVQALIFHELRCAMPKMTGKDKKQKELIASLEDVFFKVMKTYNVPAGDFPDVNRFRHTLATSESCRDFTKFRKLDDKLLATIDAILRDHVTALMAEFEAIPSAPAVPVPAASHAPPVAHAPHETDPWSAAPPQAPLPAATRDPWATGASDKAKYDKIFAQMQPEDGKVSGAKVAPVLKRSDLGNEMLRDVWNLVDVAQDGMLDCDYFAVAMHLTMRAKRGVPLPDRLTPELVPPRHRS